MPLKNYCVLKARVTGKKLATKNSPHYQVLLEDEAGSKHRIAINVMSQLAPSELLYYFTDNFEHELIDRIKEADLPSGFTPVPSEPNGLALDFVRRNLFDSALMKPLPFDLPGPDNDLNEKLDFYITKALNDPGAELYAFGERWGPESNRKDQYFGFLPGSGIHDIHMNQGNEGKFRADNGTWQDGGMLLHFTQTDEWVALFLAFQSQSFHTDEQGNPMAGAPSPATSEKDLYIIAALVSPGGSEEEKVYLLNATSATISLDGYMLTDKLERGLPLDGLQAGAGEVVIVPVTGDQFQLSNNGGTLSLLDPTGKNIAGVSYTKSQASRKGRLIVF
ncbi:DUF2278 family protein [Dyadobacter sandarakinus]|uniref:DUF2278 family protein n=1 Tax=Dyadobacter sandarakinus TaxID=2747268 RepID=A0ABX7I1E4_9BACT|nr:DUF2278 family protein [Dyadobacter sandarakinus]QRQ99890.1 DUF2278 family protein [Dyadobacter sandarakinus]